MKRIAYLDNLLYPVMLILTMIALHFHAGTIQLDINSSDAQRDLNTAVGTSLLSGVFLLSIRIIQQNVAKHLFLMLNVIRKPQDFWFHRKKLSEQFKRHVIWSLSLGFVMPLLYMVSEGVIARINEREVFAVAMGAVPLWLLMSLFILQITTVNRYLWKFLSNGSIEAIDKIKLYRSVIKIAVTTIFMTSMVFLVIPVFWIKQPVHFFDMVFIVSLVLFFVVFLVAPTIKFICIVRKIKCSLARDLDRKIDRLIKESVVAEKSKEIEYLLSIKERYCDSWIFYRYK